MKREPEPDVVNQLADGYERMRDRIRQRLAAAEVNAPLSVFMAIEEAREKAVALRELSRDEAEQVAQWLRRDLLHLRENLAKAERGVGDTLSFDLGLIEQGLLDTLADPTRVDWLQLQEEFATLPPWQAGEVTAPGTLECLECGLVMDIPQTGTIPGCPGCGGMQFRRP